TLHEKCGFDYVAAVIKHAEHAQIFSGMAIHEVSPHAVNARRFFKERDDFLEALDGFDARDESAFRANEQRHDAESARSGCDDAVVAGNTFESSAGIRMCSFPVVAEAGFFEHGEEFIIGQGTSGSAD